MKLSSSRRCKYAGQHGAVETARDFSRKLEKHVSENTEEGVFIFRRWARATKMKRDENLTDEIFLTRKFPDLR